MSTDAVEAGCETTSAVRALSAAEQAGITYRQLDHWTRQGWIKAEPRIARRLDWPPGSGHPRSYPQVEVEIAGRMGRLVKAGVTARVAAQVARRGDVVTETILYLLRPVNHATHLEYGKDWPI